MTEQELRALVRSIVDSRLSAGTASSPPAAPIQSTPSSAPAGVPLGPVGVGAFAQAPTQSSRHSSVQILTLSLSHERFALSPAPDGRCFIEPAVACNHCGYCQSYGH